MPYQVRQGVNALGVDQDLEQLKRSRQVNALGAMDVQRAPVLQAREDQQYQQEQDANQANQGIAAAQWILQSPSPRQAAFQQFPDIVAQYQKAGLQLESDDDVREVAQELLATLSAGQGIGPAKPEEYTLAPGAQRMAGEQVLAQAPFAPEKPPSPTDDMREFQYGQQNPQFAQYQADQNPQRVPASEPLESVMDEKGHPILVPRSQAAGRSPATSRQPTEGDKRNDLMFSSMVNAEQQIADLMNAGKTTDTSSMWNQALGAAHLGAMQSDDFKAYEAAGLRWAANLLYMKSGATATPDEIRSTWRQFFPQPGEGEDVKQQKQSARQQEMQSAATITGGEVPDFGPRRINTAEEYAALPKGTRYTSPDGKQRTKQ